MTIIKQILTYLIWILISFLSAFGYMRIILGPKPKPSTGFMQIMDWTYGFVMLEVGLKIGVIISLLYILLDIFYLKKILKNNSKRIVIRFLIIITITFVVGAIHYTFEKII